MINSFYDDRQQELYLRSPLCLSIFRALAERYEEDPMIVATKLVYAEWTEIFVDANLTAGPLD